MLYIFEQKITNKITVYNLLCKIGGLNNFQVQKIIQKAGIFNNFKAQYLSQKQKKILSLFIEDENQKISKSLKTFKLLNEKRLVTIKSYRGLRKLKGLPIRGQRTHTNAKTARKRF